MGGITNSGVTNSTVTSAPVTNDRVTGPPAPPISGDILLIDDNMVDALIIEDATSDNRLLGS